MNIIRPQTKDLEHVARLFDEYRQFYHQPSDIEGAKAFIKQRYARQDSLILGAYCHDQLAAFVQVYPTLSSIGMGNIWLINDLYVAEAFRSKGLARALLTQVIDEAKAVDINIVRISTEKTNSTADALYRRIGFEPDGRFQHFNYFIPKG